MVMDVQYVPTEFDVLLPDVHSKDLHENISNILNIKYLETAESDDVKEAVGIVHGWHNRVFVSTVMKKGDRLRHVHFLVDTGSPFTYICNEVLQSLGVEVSHPHTPVTVHINGMPTIILQSHGHFDDVNLLGTNFMKLHGCVLTANFEKNTVKLVFDSD